MNTVCFGCTKYEPTDPLAQTLAYLCSAPYFAIFYQTTVRSLQVAPVSEPYMSHKRIQDPRVLSGLHSRGVDMLSPQVVYCRRELHAITTLVGMVVNAALGKGLKRLLRQTRPLAGCERLGNCMKHGMPSSHAQLMFFVWAMHALLVFRRRPRSRAQSLLQIAESLFLGVVSVAVAGGRVYLGYHDISQVCSSLTACSSSSSCLLACPCAAPD